MKPLLMTALLALAASQADAGELDFGFGFDKSDGSKGWHIRIGARDRHAQPAVPSHRHQVARRVWVPGHYDTVTTRVWVPGHMRRVLQPASYGFRYDACGNRVRFVVRPAVYIKVRTPGHYETRRERVWVPGHHEVDHRASHRAGRRTH